VAHPSASLSQAVRLTKMFSKRETNALTLKRKCVSHRSLYEISQTRSLNLVWSRASLHSFAFITPGGQSHRMGPSLRVVALHYLQHRVRLGWLHPLVESCVISAYEILLLFFQYRSGHCLAGSIVISFFFCPYDLFILVKKGKAIPVTGRREL
jgi:hypothetical protein